MIEHFYESIPGWFNFQDIYKEQVERARDGAVFVEVGSWLGRSTAYMAVEIANSGKQISFFAVDTWRGSPAEQYQAVVREMGGTAYEAFLENMERGSVRAMVTPMVGLSALSARAFNDREVDFVFLDAAHDFHSVRADVRAWLPKVRVGGVIAGHDANCPGLMNAVREYIRAGEIEYTGTSWVHRVHAGSVSGIPIDQMIGVFDAAMGALAAHDYDRRGRLAGLRVMQWPTPTDADLAPYIAKWGGPPGEETFDFPYGVTTLDW
jgi:predicted O-methyltransferase YrrM